VIGEFIRLHRRNIDTEIPVLDGPRASATAQGAFKSQPFALVARGHEVARSPDALGSGGKLEPEG
jgi:hypothetical protein